jgi:transposase
MPTRRPPHARHDGLDRRAARRGRGHPVRQPEDQRLRRALHLVRGGAVKSRTACINEMKALVVTAPAELREQLPARAADLAGARARLHPGGDLADPAQGIRCLKRYIARELHKVLTRPKTRMTRIKDLAKAA